MTDKIEIDIIELSKVRVEYADYPFSTKIELKVRVMPILDKRLDVFDKGKTGSIVEFKFDV